MSDVPAPPSGSTCCWIFLLWGKLHASLFSGRLNVSLLSFGRCAQGGGPIVYAAKQRPSCAILGTGLRWVIVARRGGVTIQ